MTGAGRIGENGRTGERANGRTGPILFGRAEAAGAARWHHGARFLDARMPDPHLFPALPPAPSDALPADPRAATLIRQLRLQPHPEGGWYREVFRSGASVDPLDGRPRRAALTTIDFLLAPGERSAWHRVASDEVWHLLEGGPLRLWLLSPALDRLETRVLRAVPPQTEAVDGVVPSTGDGSTDSAEPAAPRAVVPAGWWQAAEPLDGFAYVGATVGPGFDFDDFRFGRDAPGLHEALRTLGSDALRLL